MPPKHVVIEVSPSRLEAVVVRAGAAGESRVQRFSRTDWPGQFADALKDLSGPLTQMVGELGCAGWPTSVIYLAPGAVTNLTSCAVGAGIANAEQAARLAIANTADFVLDGSPFDSITLLSEKASETDAAHIPQNHILAAADSEARVAAIAELCTSAGLAVDRLIPFEALAFAQAAQLVSRPEVTSLRAVLWLGEHSSALAVGMASRLFFVRSVNAGLESLTEALTRPIRAASENVAPVTLTREQARSLLSSIGIPARDQTIPDQPDLAGSALLPHLQPILQRLAIEVKQSLRFGIPESQRGKVSLQIAGPGAHIPGLTAVLARQAGVPDSPVLPGDEAMSRPISALLAHPAQGINLLPCELRSVAVSRRLRSALVAGAALTAALVAFEYGSTWYSLHKESARLAQLQGQHDAAAASAASRDAVLASRAALGTLEQRIRTRIGDRPDVAAALSLLAQETPDTMHLTEVSIGTENMNGDFTVRGYLRSADVTDPPGVINRYIAALSSIPAVKEARLGPTLRGTMRGSESQSFEVRLELVGIPPITPTSTPVTNADPAKEGR